MELNLESKEMVKFKFHPEKKSISEKSLNFDRKYSGYIGNKYCMYFNYNIISQKLPKFCYYFCKIFNQIL